MLTMEILQFPWSRRCQLVNTPHLILNATNWVPDRRPFHTSLPVFSLQADFQLNSLTNQLLHVTSLNWTAARLVSSLYNLGADPTENTASNNPSIVVMGGCLAIDWISFSRELVYRPLLSNACFFSRSLHSNGITCYNNFPLCCKRKQTVTLVKYGRFWSTSIKTQNFCNALGKLACNLYNFDKYTFPETGQNIILWAL
jgi:hypothetical protein